MPTLRQIERQVKFGFRGLDTSWYFVVELLARWHSDYISKNRKWEPSLKVFLFTKREILLRKERSIVAVGFSIQHSAPKSRCTLKNFFHETGFAIAVIIETAKNTHPSSAGTVVNKRE